MFISYNWLHELTGTKLTADVIRDRLTNVGLAVDAVEARGNDFVLDVDNDPKALSTPGSRALREGRIGSLSG